MPVPAGIDEMNARRRHKRKISILQSRIVRRDKARKHNRQLQQQQESYSDNEFLANHHYSVRTRGSTATSRASARRFPIIMNTVEDIKTPMTTYRSLEREASSKSGPNPGQPVITSTSNEPLSNPASDNP